MKKGIISTIIAILEGIMIVIIKMGLNKKIKETDEMLKKIHDLYMAFDQWTQIHQRGKSLKEYFRQRNYKLIAIYGMKELGERLYDELKGSDIEVAYIIDKNADAIYADVDVVEPDEELTPVDVIVVTAIYYFDEIEEMLNKKIKCPVVSLEDILYEV